MTDVVELALPFRGTWRVENSPARRVPSHGTHLFATTYAIDFVAVRDGRSASVRDWRTALGTEPPERFVGFGVPVLAPASGRVVAIHDGEPDHEARRSPSALIGYALTQAARARSGAGALAGNHVIVELDRGRAGTRAFVVLAHLRAGSPVVAVGDRVATGQQVGACGNSGNSTQPHVHVQAMDGLDPYAAHGLPITFTAFRRWPRRRGVPVMVDRGVPGEADVVEPV